MLKKPYWFSHGWCSWWLQCPYQQRCFCSVHSHWPRSCTSAKNNAQIDWELKLEADSDSKNGSIEYVESVKESHGGRMSHDGGRSSSSSNSSSNDESHFVEENMVVIEYPESKDDALSSVARSDALRM
ncbi:hypothetical protein LOK49_Contig635G00001 [Camellia lanceoleosa]|nr:hypothetical protein LOK49_Contig635G00001 [Camellia lanceoleosa]